MLLRLLPAGMRPVIFIDETLERRKGEKITAKGYYRDAVRSTKSQVVKAYGLKWLVAALSVRFPFMKRAFALPFLSVLQPSSQCNKERGRRHKTTLDWTCQILMLLIRWLPQVPFILVGDGGFACGRLAWLCLKYNVTLVTRLKMNARLYAFPEECVSGKRGRKAKKGARLYTFKEMLSMIDLNWVECEVIGYGGKKKKVRYHTNTALWGVEGCDPIPIRFVLLVDPEGIWAPLPLMCTDYALPIEQIIALYIDRWGLEVTFEEVREHLGVETQRQWSDLAIERITPVLMALYSLVCLIANAMQQEEAIEKECTAWYKKETVTFGDLLKAVRKRLWMDSSFYRKVQITASVENEVSNCHHWLDVFVECLSRAA